MLRHVAVAMISSALAVACASTPAQRDEVRIDATSSESAEASYQAMTRNQSAAERQKLDMAMLVLNMEGVKSAREAMDNPELQSLSIGRIKDKVAGMTAKQIIELAARNPSVRIEVSGQ